MKNFTVWVAVSIVLLLAACSEKDSQERQLKDNLADADQSPVTSCNWSDMEKQRIDILSWVDEGYVCSTLQSAIGHPPTIALTRKLSKVIFVMRAGGIQGSVKDVAYQIMNIVEARGQENNNQEIDGTLETVLKIFNGTQGHVTPSDINLTLRSSGDLAKTISDDGVINMAVLIWEEKKGRGL